MTTEEKSFKNFARKLAIEDQDVSSRRMMSSPGIKYKNKVFAFYHNKEMIFRLGKQLRSQQTHTSSKKTDTASTTFFTH